MRLEEIYGALEGETKVRLPSWEGSEHIKFKFPKWFDEYGRHTPMSNEDLSAENWEVYEEPTEPKHFLSDEGWFDENIMEYHELISWSHGFRPAFKSTDVRDSAAKGFYTYVYEMKGEYVIDINIRLFKCEKGNLTRNYMKGRKPVTPLGVVVFKESFYE